VENVSDIYPLSPMQQLMLMHALADPTHDQLFNQFHYRLTGPLDADAFRQAWQQLTDRHAALRTLFLWDDLKEPLQVVRSHVETAWQVKDWRALTSGAFGEGISNFLKTDRAEGFQLDQGPPMRLCLIQRAPDDFDLVWSSHHLIVDRWCLDILMAELAQIYRGIIQAQRPELSAAPGYRDYIAWLQSQNKAASEAYWRETLAGFTTPIGLAPARQAGGQLASDLQRRIAPETVSRLRLASRGSQLTLSTWLQGVWALLLGRLSGQNDLVFGLTVSGRPPALDRVESIVGTFVNNIPVRVDLQSDRSFASWLQDLHGGISERQRHEHVSLVEIQSWSELPARRPLFDCLLLHQSGLSDDLQLDEGVRMRAVSGSLSANYPLILMIAEGETSFALQATYDRRVFDETLAGKLLDSFLHILETCLAQPDHSLSVLLAHTRADPELAALFSQSAEDAASVPIDLAREILQPPSSVTELKLSELWLDVLGSADIDLGDNFFEQGGASIQVAELTIRLRDAFEVQFPLDLVLSEPVFGKLAERIDLILWSAANERLADQAGGQDREAFEI
jgi:acyl carrier protein